MAENALRAAFKQLPVGKRDKARKALAKEHQVTPGTVYSWERNRHPEAIEQISITEQFFEYRLTRFELRPDIWDRKELVQFLKQTSLDMGAQ